MATTPQHQDSSQGHIWISQPEGKSNFFSGPGGRFTFVSTGSTNPAQFLQLDPYSAAMAFVEGRFDVRGDIFEAIRSFSAWPHSTFRHAMFSVLAQLDHLRISSLFANKKETARNIQFHYDRSNEFYSKFLDSRMMYSAGYFSDPDDTLEQAQLQKLGRICRDLVLRADERFLDVGCGWGGLITYAAERFGVRAFGCTLAEQQLMHARNAIKKGGLSERVQVELCDYRDLTGSYDKIASVGMFEHVERGKLRQYFDRLYSLLAPGGLLLNRGVVRPQNTRDGPDTLFIQRNVFPGGHLVRLDEVVREGERAGFEVVGLRDLRTHYALTCRCWVQNLQQNVSACRRLVGDRTYRTWVLYLAASSVALEDNRTAAAQVLFAKRRG